MDALATVMLSHNELNLHVRWGYAQEQLEWRIHDEILTAIPYHENPGLSITVEEWMEAAAEESTVK